MKTIRVGLGSRAYDIQVGRGLLDSAGERIREVCRPSKAVIITDDIVYGLYGARLETALGDLPHRVLVLPHGEGTKCVEQYARALSFCASYELTRGDLLIALGGGVIGDLTGFVASTYLRGLPFVQIPTTLLSQVDSSVGGKTAINLPEGKNLVGAFWQPVRVIADVDLLDSLPPREFAGGMAEVIKTAALFDESLFTFLETHASPDILRPYLDGVVAACCDLKRRVVEEDERDTGKRMLLNFGHTFGHAIEVVGGFSQYIHGEAVSLGMILAAKAGISRGETPNGTDKRLSAICRAFGLPTEDSFSAEEIKATLLRDKKRSGQTLRFIFLSRIGGGIARDLSVSRVSALVEELCHGH